jgi:hypothetical protein
MNKFSDFADTTTSPVLDGRKMALDDVLNKELIILRYRIKKSKFSEAKNPDCLTIQFAFPEKEDEHYVLFSGSSVLMDQLEKYKDKLPFSATIKKIGKYFTLT